MATPRLVTLGGTRLGQKIEIILLDYLHTVLIIIMSISCLKIYFNGEDLFPRVHSIMYLQKPDMWYFKYEM